MYVLDSSVLIEVVKERPLAGKIERLVQDAPLVTTSICMHEVLAGARSPEERFGFEALFTKMHVLEHTADAAKAGARIAHELARTGTPAGTPDTLIAGICKANNAALVTLDKGFARIKGIKTHLIA
jgi:predicted nucleic acid-binding protein